jgi:hypothetical protein
VPTCVCGKGVSLWSALDEQGYCSDKCYEKVHPQIETKMKYVAHGVYEVESSPL